MFNHYSVLNKETVFNVINDKSGVYVDGTLGGAGHTFELLNLLNDDAKVYSFDQDFTAINHVQQNSNIDNLHLIHSNFKYLTKELNARGISNINGLILDLGFSSPQVDDPTRGFSYMQDGPLDMRMDKRQELTAKIIINTYSKQDLTYIFSKYGEEKNSSFIANGIIKAREINEINSTLELVQIIEDSIPISKKKKIKGHIAKKVFQALRIEVNEELKVLDDVLDQAFKILKPKGRLSIITFHSLEDKIVKHKYKKLSEVSEDLLNLPEIPKDYLPKATIINKKPILPSKKEIEENNRSKSAKLRILEKNEI